MRILEYVWTCTPVVWTTWASSELIHNACSYGKAHCVPCASWAHSRRSDIFSASKTLSFTEDGVEERQKQKLICHHNTELIPPLSINFLLQELHALSQVTNKVEVISSWMPFQRVSRALWRHTATSFHNCESLQSRTQLAEALTYIAQSTN